MTPMLSLGEVSSIRMGQSPKGDTYNTEGIGLPLLNGPTEFGPIYPYCTLFTTDTKRECQAGDLLFCVRGSTTGRMNWADRRYSLGRGVCSFRAETQLETRFVRYAIECHLHELLQLSTGASTFPNLSKNDIHKFRIPWPETRSIIASILLAYDHLIENNARRIAILEDMARRLYDEWFVDFRFPGHHKAECAGKLPKGWNLVPLIEVCTRITDGSHRSPATVAEGRTMCSVKDMREWGFDLTACKTISDNEFAELVRNDCQPRPGDILIAKDGANLNKHTFLVTEQIDAVVLSSIAIIRPKPDIEREFLVAQLKSEAVSQKIKNSATGAAIPRIILTDFKRLPVIVPSVEVQSQWCNVVGPIHAQCRTLTRKNANLRAQRDLLLPKLISGEIDVSQVAQPEAEADAA